MIHHRDRLPLGFKARDHGFGIHAELDDLERHAAADRFGLLGHVNHAAAALADLLKQLVAANRVPGLLGEGNGDVARLAQLSRSRLFQKIFGLVAPSRDSTRWRNSALPWVD